MTVSPFDRERHISCALVTNDPAERIKVFKAALSIVAPIEFRGEDSLHFGRVESGKTVTAEAPLVVRTASNSPPQILSIRGSSPELSARALGKLVPTVGSGQVVEWQIPVLVEFTPTARLGDSPLNLRATVMVDGRNEVAELPVHWQRVRQFEMTPRRVILEVKGGELGVVSASVLIRRCDGMPFQIGEAQCTSPKFDLEVKRVAPDATIVSINARYSPENNERLAGG